MTRKSQKVIECIYLKEFLECIGCKPEEIEYEREKPDFIISMESKRIGVEVTEFHSQTDSTENFTRREVEETWIKLQNSLKVERKNHKELQNIYGLLSFKRLLVPPRSKHKEFINEIIQYTLSRLPLPKNTEQTSSDFPPEYPLMNKFLESIRLEHLECSMTWEWNHESASGGLTEEVLVNILGDKKEKLEQYERTNLHKMWLLMVSDYSISQFMGIPNPAILNGYSKCNELLNQSGFDKVYIYQRMQDRILEWSGAWKIKIEGTRNNFNKQGGAR